MPDATPTPRDINRVTCLDGAVKARKSGQEGHRKRHRIAEAQGWRLGDGEELACDGIAAFACFPPVATQPPSPFKSAMAATASPTATPFTPWPTATTAPARSRPRTTGGVRPMKLRSASLYSSSVSCVSDAEKRLRNRLSLLDDAAASHGMSRACHGAMIPKSARLARFSSNHSCSWPGSGMSDPASMMFV